MHVELKLILTKVVSYSGELFPVGWEKPLSVTLPVVQLFNRPQTMLKRLKTG